jgi:hypothetical protein
MVMKIMLSQSRDSKVMKGNILFLLSILVTAADHLIRNWQHFYKFKNGISRVVIVPIFEMLHLSKCKLI